MNFKEEKPSAFPFIFQIWSDHFSILKYLTLLTSEKPPENIPFLASTGRTKKTKRGGQADGVENQRQKKKVIRGVKRREREFSGKGRESVETQETGDFILR